MRAELNVDLVAQIQRYLPPLSHGRRLLLPDGRRPEREADLRLADRDDATADLVAGLVEGLAEEGEDGVQPPLVELRGGGGGRGKRGMRGVMLG